MKVSSIGAMSYNQTARSVKSMTQTFDNVQKKVHHHKGGTMKALAAAAAISMASLGLTGCPQPIDPTPIEIPAEDPATETPAAEDPATETPAVDIENSPIVNAIRDFGFGIDVVDVEPVEGLYTPETGDLVDLKFNNRVARTFYHMQLDRENSTKDNLVYNGNAIYTLYNEEYDIHEDFDKMIFDKENYALIFAGGDGYIITTMRIALDENNAPVFMYCGYETCYEERPREVYDGVVFKPPGIDHFGGFEIQLAK